MAVNVDGVLPAGVTAKDIVLALIAKVGTGGGQGYIVEYRGVGDRGALHGGPDDDLQHEHRVGRQGRHDRAGRDHVRLCKGRPHAPEGEDWDAAVEYWRTLRSDADAIFDAEVDPRRAR